MPIYEYYCLPCDLTWEKLLTKTYEIKSSSCCRCPCCTRITNKVMSPTKFKVTGFNAKNGYNLPNYNDVVDVNGYAKEEWGRD